VPYLAALAVTLLVEVPIYRALGRRALDLREGGGLRLYGGVNLVSHPLLWFGLAPAGVALVGATAGVLAAEGLVVAGEGLAVAHVARVRQAPALAVAALANAASFGAGLAIWRL
jgi:hypothetical protein